MLAKLVIVLFILSEGFVTPMKPRGSRMSKRSPGNTHNEGSGPRRSRDNEIRIMCENSAAITFHSCMTNCEQHSNGDSKGQCMLEECRLAWQSSDQDSSNSEEIHISFNEPCDLGSSVDPTNNNISVTSNCLQCSSTSQTIIQYSTVTTTSTITPPCTQVASTVVHYNNATDTASVNSSAFRSTCNCNTPLGVLLGLMIAIVIVITVGWAYTCWKARNNGKTKALFKLRSKILQTTHGDEERLFENPTYDATTSTEQQQGRQAQQQQRFPGITYAIYDTVTTPSQTKTQNGETYNVLQRGKENARLPCITEYQQYIHKGAVGRSGARRVVSSNQDMSYSLLGLPDKDVQHNYHVVEQH